MRQERKIQLPWERNIIIPVYMRFWKCMGAIGGCLYDVWEVFGNLMEAIGGRYYEVWEVYGDLRGP